MVKKKEKIANKRSFSFTEPILYGGNSYPSSKATLLDENGNETQGTIFAGAQGNYYTLSPDGKAHPAMLTDTLPEVVVTPSKCQEQLSPETSHAEGSRI